MSAFVVVPQWQGSPSSRAMRLVDGAEAIRGDLPSSATHIVAVPAEAGDALDTGIHRFSSVLAVRRAQLETMSRLSERVITIGGGCGVEVAAIQHAVDRADGDVAVVWFDAHPDANTPASSPSGAFDGMALRAVIGGVHESLDLREPLPLSRVALSGARAIDDGETEVFIAASGYADAEPEDGADLVLERLEASGARTVYVHVGLDVIDPSDITGTTGAEPFGLGAAELVERIGAIRERFELAGAGITGFAPSSPAAATDDMGTILRIVGALAR